MGSPWFQCGLSHHPPLIHVLPCTAHLQELLFSLSCNFLIHQMNSEEGGKLICASQLTDLLDFTTPLDPDLLLTASHSHTHTHIHSHCLDVTLLSLVGAGLLTWHWLQAGRGPLSTTRSHSPVSPSCESWHSSALGLLFTQRSTALTRTPVSDSAIHLI